MSDKIYSIVTEKILEALDRGVVQAASAGQRAADYILAVGV